MEAVESISPLQLAAIIRNEKALVVDARTFCEYNTCHIFNSINVWCSKLRKKRLQQNAISVFDYLQQACQVALQDGTPNEVVVYDQNSQDVSAITQDTFTCVLLQKLTSAFKKVLFLSGGFLMFQSLYPELMEDSTQKISSLTSLSQPCMPVAKSGPTRILPFLFLGSQYDANNKQMLVEHNIMYELNVSTSCAKPEFLQDSYFLRIPVNDSFSEKLLPYFGEAFRFIDKVREAGGRVLVHCLAGISRSPTVAIAYVMKHLRLHFDEAYRYVKKRRPTISPNINFVGQLLELDKQLLGEGSLYRSPTTPLCLEYDSSLSFDLQPSPESLILKSSSSSCLESNKKEISFSPKRSLPSLKLQDSTESEECSVPQTLDECSALALLSLVNEQLPSSPVVTLGSPSSPNSFKSYPIFGDSKSPICKCSDTKSLSTSSHSSGKETLEQFVNSNRNLFQDRRICRTVSSDSQPLFACKDTSLCVNKTYKVNTSRHSDVIQTHNSENYSTTALINVNCHEKSFGDNEDKNRRKSICVIEVTHEKSPVTFIHEDPKPMIVRETHVLADPPDEESSCLASSQSGKANEEVMKDKEELDLSTMSCKVLTPMEKSNSLPASKSKPPIAVPPSPSETSSSKVAPSSGSIPTSPSKQQISYNFPCKRMESKYLPRSYSSSETHLNTRRLLESQVANTSPDTCTRKSFSTDEVSKAWSQQSSPQTPSQLHLSVPFSRDDNFFLTSPSELARCDSWSTSGLGSEISDGDSQQGDVHTLILDDSQGPYDAVFADVYPGETTEVVFRDSCRKISSSRDQEAEFKHKTTDQKSSKSSRSQKPPHRPAAQTLSLKSQGSAKETIGGCTPRPVSLPGVTGTYNVRLKDQSSSIDMGVEMDDSPDWQSEKGQEVFKYEPAKNVPIKTSVSEHPPVSSRTMGDDVKHMMTWFKIDPLPRGSLPSKRSNQEKYTVDQRKFSNLDPVESPQKERQNQSKSSSFTLNTLSAHSKENKGLNKEICKSKSEKQLTRQRETRPSRSPLRENTKDGSPLAESDTTHSTKPKRSNSTESIPKSKTVESNNETASPSPEEDVPSIGSKPNGGHEDVEKAYPTIDERLHWWDNEFKRKIRNIQKHVSLKSWDVAPEDKFMEENLPAERPGLAGIQLAQELVQSMEDLLESEISDIKRQADVLRDRFGLGEASSGYEKSHKETREDYERGHSLNVTFKPCVLRHHNQSPFSKNPNRASITLPINYSISELSAGIQSKKDGGSKPLQDKTNWIDVAQSVRAQSEPPLCGDEGLYRARSCPGLQEKLEDHSKDPLAKGFLCVTLRSRPPNYPKESNRYSWTAPPDIIPLTPPPPFESCPDISKLKSFLFDNTSNSSGNSCSSPHSSSRLLPVS